MIAAGGGLFVNLGSWVARLSVPVGALHASTRGAVLDDDGGRTGAAVIAGGSGR